MGDEHLAHPQHPLARAGVAQQVDRDPGDAERPLVDEVAAQLEQGHGRVLDALDGEPVLGEQRAPLGGGERAGVDLDRGGEGAPDLGLLLVGEGVGLEAELVDGVAAAGAEHAVRLGDDRVLALGALHGEHRLGEHHVRGAGVEAGLGGGRAGHVAGRPHDVGGGLRGGRVVVDAAVAARTGGEQQARGLAQAGRELDHVLALGARRADQPLGEPAAAGAQDALAEAREHPVAGQVVDRAVRHGQFGGCAAGGGVGGHGVSSGRAMLTGL